MNRREFLMGAAAALVAVPTAAEAAWTVAEHMTAKTPFFGEGWYIISYDTANGEDRSVRMTYRIHDECIYVVNYDEDFDADKLRARWRAVAPDIAKWWGTEGQ
jgi:hypothetical protein